MPPHDPGTALISVVVPVFNEADGILAFHERTTRVLSNLEGMAWELIYVDDGSSDASFQALCGFAAGDPRVKVLRFSRNFGHQIAISAGLDHARGDCVAVIDSDLQDPPEVIAEMLAQWRLGFDVVYGVRSDRAGETAMKLMTASAFYRILGRLTNIQIPANVGDFRLVSRRVVEHLRLLREKDRFVRGLVSWVGFRQIGIPYQRDARHAGETKYPFGKMLKFAFDGITSFSTAPLRLATWLGLFAAVLAVIYLLSVFVQKLLGHTVQGWATIMVALLFLGSVQLIVLGILGEYLGRIFMEVKPRPMYVIAEHLGTPDGNPTRDGGREIGRGDSQLLQHAGPLSPGRGGP